MAISYRVDSRFIAQYERIAPIAGSTGYSSGRTRGSGTEDNHMTIRVEIISVVTDPDVAYIKASNPQFTAFQILESDVIEGTPSAVLIFDSSVNPIDDGIEFTVGNLYGFDMDDFDHEDPDADAFKNKYVGKTFDAVRRYVWVKDPSSSEEELKEVWGIIPSAVSKAYFGLCTIVSEADGDDEYNVTVNLGNPNIAVVASELPKGILYLNYATTNAVAIDAQLMVLVYDYTGDVEPTEADPKGITFDCHPIETLYNLIAAPEEEEEAP